MYDFDKIVDRSKSDAYKYAALEPDFGSKDLMPLWIADFEFETPSFILDAIKERLNHPVLGYTKDPAEYWPSVIEWVKSHHGWDIKREWLSYIPGIVRGIGMAINALTQPGEGIIIMPPVYHPFRHTIENTGRVVVNNPLKEKADGGYEIDFEHLENVAPGCKMLILCNPHNPGGIVWPREVLERLADFCYEKGILVISDEIHCDLALFGNKHTPFGMVSEKAAKISICFQAPTKTFNIAGLISSFAIVSDDDLRDKFYGWMSAAELNDPNMFAPIATVAAFTKGEPWRKALLAYLEDNIRFVEDFCARNMPQIKPLRPQASFLVWLDCRELGLSQPELVDFFLKKAKLALNDGSMFGAEGNGFMRMNIGEPRSMLAQALEQLASALNA